MVRPSWREVAIHSPEAIFAIGRAWAGRIHIRMKQYRSSLRLYHIGREVIQYINSTGPGLFDGRVRRGPLRASGLNNVGNNSQRPSRLSR